MYVSLAHYNNFQKSHYENCYPYIKLLKKSLQLRKKVVVFMDDNYIIPVLVVVYDEGLITIKCKVSDPRLRTVVRFKN